MVQFDVTAVDAAQAQAFATIMSQGLTSNAMVECLRVSHRPAMCVAEHVEMQHNNQHA